MQAWNLSVWQMIGLVALAGFVGGIINALVTENGFVLPGVKTIGDNKVFQPGVLGVLIAGPAAAALSWGLYGPAKDFVLARAVPVQQAGQATATTEIALTIATLAGAVILGFGGAKWLSSEVDKRLLKSSIAVFARHMPDSTLAARVAGVSPSGIANLAAAIARPNGPDERGVR